MIRKIIGDYLSTDATVQKEKVQAEIESHKGQINLLQQQLKDLEVNESKQQEEVNIEANRKEYLKSHPDVILMYQKDSIGSKGYKILQTALLFKNKDEVNRWLGEQ